MIQGSIGVDIGGTKIAIGYVDLQGNILAKTTISSEVSHGPELITQAIATEIKKLLSSRDYSPVGVGVGMAGQIDPHTGLVHFAPNLQWTEFPFGEHLTKYVQMPVFVTNDVRAATIGEWQFGAGKGYSDLVCLFVGTGVGGGIVSRGQLQTGSTNSAGELGHIIVDLNGPKCTCGSYGCLEALAGGWAIGHKGREIAEKFPEQAKQLLTLTNGDISAINAKVISQAAAQKDPLALQIIYDVVKALSAGVISIVNGLNPSCVIIGGGFIEGNHELILQIDKEVRSRALNTATKQLKIMGAALKTKREW